MKGRRRARQAALQALYELDLTAHPGERVLAERVRELYRSSAARALERGDRRVVEALLDESADSGFSDVDIDEIASRFGAKPERVETVVEMLRSLVGHATYCRHLVRGVRSNREALDDVIGHIAPEWPVDQMAAVDRNVLRIALYEIASGSSPVRVAINEAVELARLFSGEASRRMVNGALGAFVTGNYRVDMTSGQE